MAFTAEELTAWVKTLGLSEDEQKAMLISLGKPEVLPKVGGSILMQAEFSRKMDDLAKEKTKLDADYQKDRQTLVDWRKSKEQVLVDANTAKEKAERALAAHNDKIKALAVEYSISEDKVKEILADAPVVDDKNRNEERQRSEDGRYLKREEFDRIGQDYVKVPAILMAIQTEHMKLFGSNGAELDTIKLVENAQKNKRSLRDEWENEFKVSDQRAAVAKAQHDKEISAAEQRGEESARSKFLAENPGAAQNVRNINAPGSPVLDNARARYAKDAKEKSGPADVDEGRGVSAAVRAFNEGKYDQGLRKPLNAQRSHQE